MNDHKLIAYLLYINKIRIMIILKCYHYIKTNSKCFII